MDFSIGTNTLRNTNGCFVVQDQIIMQVELGQQKGELFLTMELFNPTGTSVAKLKRNQWEGDNPDRFEISVEPYHISVRDTTLKKTVLQINLEEDGTVAISQAKFHLPNGTLSEITPDWWHVGNTLELKGAEVDLEGGAIVMQD